MDRMTQWRRILRLLEEDGSVTAGQLMTECGIGSPRKRLSELRHSKLLEALGFEITDRYEEGHNRWGEPVRYKRYYLEERKV